MTSFIARSRIIRVTSSKTSKDDQMVKESAVISMHVNRNRSHILFLNLKQFQSDITLREHDFLDIPQ